MNKMIVVVFDSESKASEGSKALRKLNAEGSIILWAMGVITRCRREGDHQRGSRQRPPWNDRRTGYWDLDRRVGRTRGYGGWSLCGDTRRLPV